MQTPSAVELLNIWDWGQTRPPLERVLFLLAAMEPQLSSEAVAELPVGQRDTRLLDLRERLFGPYLVCLAVCPDCGEQLELNFSVTDITDGSRSGSSTQEALSREGSEILSLNMSGFEVLFRLPNSRDLQALAEIEAPADARQQLLQRCMRSAGFNGEDLSLEALPEEVITAIEERMALADPQADLQLSLHCIACSHRWQTAFDIVSFLWSEIDNWAHRTLHEVHLLASAYGWSEDDILALSPWRRRYYLEKIRG